MSVTVHKKLVSGGWSTLSLAEQLGNIGSEVGRVKREQSKNSPSFQNAVDRTLELFDLTLADTRWRGRLQEIARAREVFCDALFGGEEYKSTLEDIDRYFLNFGMLARRDS